MIKKNTAEWAAALVYLAYKGRFADNKGIVKFFTNYR